MPELQNSEILEEVKAALAEHLGADASELKEDTKLVDDLGADSLDLVELTMDLEEKFDLKIPDEDVSKLVDVKSIVNYVTSHK